MARLSRDERRARAKSHAEAQLVAVAEHPEVREAFARAQARAEEIQAEHRRICAPKFAEMEEAFKAQGAPPETIETIRSAALTFNFDSEIPAFSPNDPFREEREICRKHGLALLILPDATGRPVVRFAVAEPVGASSAVGVVPGQALVPLPRLVTLYIDTHAPRSQLGQDFEQVLDNLLSVRHPSDTHPSESRRRSGKNLRETVEMLRAYSAGQTWREIGHRFHVNRTAASRRVNRLCVRLSIPLPRCGEPVRVKPEGAMCRDCPYGGCIGCVLAEDVRRHPDVPLREKLGSHDFID